MALYTHLMPVQAGAHAPRMRVTTQLHATGTSMQPALVCMKPAGVQLPACG